MKKITLKTFAAVLAVAAVMPSCLGDSHSKVEYNNAVSYIIDGEKSAGNNALANVGGAFSYFTSDYLNKLTPKKFYTLNYKVNTQDGSNADGAYVANNVIAQGLGEPVPETISGRKPSTPTYPLEVFPVAASVAFYNPYETELDDKFVFNYQCEIDPGDLNPVAHDYSENMYWVANYVEANQNTPITGGGTEPLEQNQIIVNLSLYKDFDYSVEGEKKVVYRGLGAVDLKDIRREFLRRNIRPETGSTVALGWIQFQYTKDLGDGKTETVSIGRLSNSSGSSGESYGMYIGIKNK